jgi:hypothetical protein
MFLALLKIRESERIEAISVVEGSYWGYGEIPFPDPNVQTIPR